MTSATGRPLLLIGGASMPAGRDCLVQARARGVDVWLADTAENLARTPELPAMAATVVELPYRDPAACVAWATSAQPEGGFLGVYGFRELAVESVAAVADALGLPGNPPHAVATIRDKARSRATLAAAGFRQPASSLCSDAADAMRFVAARGGRPCVVKPVDGKGSSGVTLVRDAADLPRAMARIDEARREIASELSAQGMPSAAAEHPRPFLVEEFQAGAEYSAEGVFVRGGPQLLVVTAKRTTGPPCFVEVAHAVPADLTPDVEKRLRATLSGALPALGLRWGVFHVEFWVDGDEITLGEAHARPGGDYIHVMTQHVTDVELHGAVVDELLGRPSATDTWRPKRGAAIRFLTPPPGVVRSVSGWAEVKSDPHVMEAHLALEPGSRVQPLRSSADRGSFVVTTAATGAEALAAADRLVDAVSVDVSPG